MAASCFPKAAATVFVLILVLQNLMAPALSYKISPTGQVMLPLNESHRILGGTHPCDVLSRQKFFNIFYQQFGYMATLSEEQIDVLLGLYVPSGACLDVVYY